jgi:hypothetical protein
MDTMHMLLSMVKSMRRNMARALSRLKRSLREKTVARGNRVVMTAARENQRNRTRTIRMLPAMMAREARRMQGRIAECVILMPKVVTRFGLKAKLPSLKARPIQRSKTLKRETRFEILEPEGFCSRVRLTLSRPLHPKKPVA